MICCQSLTSGVARNIYIFLEPILMYGGLIKKYAQTAKSADGWMVLFIGSDEFLAIKLE
jgi:hypothetical protein